MFYIRFKGETRKEAIQFHMMGFESIEDAQEHLEDVENDEEVMEIFELPEPEDK